MKKYKIASSTKPEFVDIEMPIDIQDDSLGAKLFLFGTEFGITQNGIILVLVEKDWVITLQELDVPMTGKIDELIIDGSLLQPNAEFEIFFETKEIQLKETKNLSKEGVTYKALFGALQREWSMAKQVFDVAFPFEYDEELKLLTMNDEWNFMKGETFSFMKEGSYSRKNASGRNI